jgi:ligand-binding sensor domain-containing protein
MRARALLQAFVAFTVISTFINQHINAQDFWTQTKGPMGGNVGALAVTSSGHILVEADGCSIYRSTNNGESWLDSNTGLKDRDVGTIVAAPAGLVFAATGDGVYRSVDNGARWTRADSGLTGIYVNQFLVCANGNIFAGTSRGIYLSTNNGENWVLKGIPSYSVGGLAVNSKGHVLAGTSKGVQRSTNNGESWAQITTGLTNEGVGGLLIDDKDDIFASTNWYMYISTDDGATWGVMNGAPTMVFSLVITKAGYVFAGGWGGVYRTTNNGNNWTEMNSGLLHTQVTCLAVNSSGHIFAGTALLASESGSDAKGIVQCTQVGYAGYGVFRSTNGGSSWVQVGVISTTITALATANNDNILASVDEGEVYLSTNNGGSWNEVLPIPMQSFVVGPSGVIYADDRRSTDNGETWTRITFPPWWNRIPGCKCERASIRWNLQQRYLSVHG